MKKILMAVLVGCMVMAGVVGTVQASDYYVSGLLGTHFGNYEWTDGYQVGIAVGNKATKHIRVEAEYQYVDTDTTLEVNTLMGNVYYDIANLDGFTPYLTTGVGVGWFDNKYGYSDHNMVYKLGAGIDYDINEDFSVGARYVYLDAVDLSWFDTNQVSAVLTYKF